MTMLSFARGSAYGGSIGPPERILKIIFEHIFSAVCVTRGFLQPSKNLSPCFLFQFFFFFFFCFSFKVDLEIRPPVTKTRHRRDIRDTVIICHQRNRIQLSDFVRKKTEKYISGCHKGFFFALLVNTVCTVFYVLRRISELRSIPIYSSFHKRTNLSRHFNFDVQSSIKKMSFARGYHGRI